MVSSTVALYLVFLTIVGVLNLVATVCLMPSAVYSGSQKSLQLALIWLLSFAGAILVISVLAHDRKSASRDPVRNDEGPWLPGIGPESDRAHHGGGFGEGAGHDVAITGRMYASNLFPRSKTEKKAWDNGASMYTF